MRRHLGFFESHMLAHDRVVLLELELVRLRPLVLLRVVREAGARGRDEADVVAHVGLRVSHAFARRHGLGAVSRLPLTNWPRHGSLAAPPGAPAHEADVSTPQSEPSSHARLP